tara:strand:- start:6071 stop:7819 length:1749 start_codon:yes stop_codon:yes gene_type:complete
MKSKQVIQFKSLIPLIRPNIRELLLGIFFMLIYVLSWPLLAWLAGKLIPAIGQGNIELVTNIIIKALFVFFIQKTAQFFQDILFAKPALLISKKLRVILFEKLQRLKLSSIEKLSTGDITYRLTEDADRVGEVIYKTIQDTTPSLFQLIAVLGYMLFLDWKLSLATLILAPIITLIITRFGQKVMITAERSQIKVSQLASLLSESIQGLPLIRSFAVESWIHEKFDNQVEFHRRARYKTLKLLALQHPFIGFIEAAGILLVLAIGTSRINSGSLSSQEFSSYFAALLMLIDPISHITTNLNELQQGKASLLRLREIENEEEEEINTSSNYFQQGSQADIEFKNVYFGYNDQVNVIKNLSLNIKKGEIVAIVGLSGAGKSTLFSLLLGFNKPKSGNILINNKNINTYNTKSIREQIGLVPQSMSLISGKIKETIKFGREANQQEIEKCSNLANAHKFIMNTKDGYETYLQERGTNLSVGQLQRISIARALIGNPTILLLDEATSALDAEAEKEVQLGLKQAMQSRTVIIIAHRLSTVQEAHKIVVLENGEIIQIGTHDDLINTSGRYRDLCEKQFINVEKSNK